MSVLVSKRRYYSTIAFLLVILSFVGVTGAWQARNALSSADDTGAGDLTRQLTYIGLALAALAPVFPGVMTRLVRSVPTSLWLLFAWCSLTLVWSPVPTIGFRRLVVTVLITFSCLSVTRQLSPEIALDVIWKALMLLLGLSVTTVIIVPELGIHQPGDPEVAVVGSWRGVFYHKNILGAVAAFSLLLSVHRALTEIRANMQRKRVWLSCAGVALSLVMLLMSGSKTSAALAVTLCGLLALLRASPRRTVRGLFATVVGLTSIVLMAATVAMASGYDLPTRMTAPDLFTGRGFIWGLILSIAKEHMFGGIGFQSVFQVGAASALNGITSSIFYDTVSHAHSAYLELLVSIGAIGLLLAIIVLFVVPLRRMMTLKGPLSGTRAFLLVSLIFVGLHAFLESGLLDRDRPSWIMFLLCYGVCLGAKNRIFVLHREGAQLREEASMTMHQRLSRGECVHASSRMNRSMKREW